MPFNYDELPDDIKQYVAPINQNKTDKPNDSYQEITNDPELRNLVSTSRPKEPDFDLTGLEKYVVRDSENLDSEDEIRVDNTVASMQKDSILNLGANVLQGTAEAGEAFFSGLHAVTEGLGDFTGLKPSGTFKDLSTIFKENSELLEQVGYHGQGFWNDVARNVARGIGRLPVDFAQILSLGKYGLPIHSALASGTGALEQGGDIDDVLVEGGKGLLQGAVLHKFIQANSLFPKRISVPTAGAVFGGAAAISGAEPSEVVSSALIGSGLQFTTKAPEYRTWMRSMNLFRPALQGKNFATFKENMVNRLKQSSESFEQIKVDMLTALNKELPASTMKDISIVSNANRRTPSMLSLLRKGVETKIKEASTRKELSHVFESSAKKVESFNEFKKAEASKATGLKKVLENISDTYRITMTPLRVADALSGYQNYEGLDARLTKRFFHAETRANSVGRWIITEYMNDLSRIGIKNVTPEMELNLTLNGLQRMGETKALKRLLKAKGLSGVPKLSSVEEGVMNLTKKYINMHLRGFAKEYELQTGKPFKKIESYFFPLKYFQEPELSTIKQVSRKVGRKPAQRGGKERFKERVHPSKTPRSDFFGLVFEGINEQQWFLNVHPQIRRTERLIKHPAYQKTATDKHYKFWREYTSAFKTKGQNAPYFKETWLPAAMRRNLTQAVLGYKLTSVLVQPFAVFDAMSYAVPQYGPKAAREIMTEVTKSLMNKEYVKAAKKRSHALTVRSGGEYAIRDIENINPEKRIKGLLNETKKALKSPYEPGALKKWVGNAYQTYLNESMSLLRELDVRTAAGSQKAVEKILKKHNVPNWRREAEVIMSMMNGSAEISMRPLILHRGEMPKLFFTFQSFFLNRWGIIAHDMFDQGILKAVNSKAQQAKLAKKAFQDPKLFETALKEKDWVIISPENPNHQTLTETKNSARRQEFIKNMKDIGYDPISAKREYKPDGYSENSYLIPGMSIREALQVAKKFGQAEILTSKGLMKVSAKTRQSLKLDQLNMKPGEDQFTTSLKIGGKDVKFSVPFSETPTRLTAEEMRPHYTQGSWKRRFNALLGLMLLSAGNVAENESRKALYEYTTGQDLPDHSRIEQFLMTVPEHVPFFGHAIQMLGRGGNLEPPLMRVLDQLFKGGYSAIAGKKPETRTRGALKVSEAAITAAFGLPGTAQLFDIAENIFAKSGKKHHINLTKRQKMIRRLRRG